MESADRKKTKIVLDADVIIHFNAAGCFNILVDIFPEYEYIVLDVVYRELRSLQPTIDKFESRPKGITKVNFYPVGDSRRDYALLRETKGDGESACMVYCKENHDVLGSSNLKDIRDFCTEHGITCLTTLDFLYYAFVRKKMTKRKCNDFMADLKQKGHKLPAHITDIEQYVCGVMI